ncbi:MAG: hypothetical protein ABSF48_14290 [Thermodesulfobacteriota bacterium]
MKFILHSVSYSPAWKGQTTLPLDKVIDKAAQLGFDGVEFIAKRPHASPLDLGADDRKRLKETIRSKGLELACITPGSSGPRFLTRTNGPGASSTSGKGRGSPRIRASSSPCRTIPR